jgi:hypothetical protein
MASIGILMNISANPKANRAPAAGGNGYAKRS